MSSYHTVAASQTGQAIAGPGQVGKKGDIIKRIIITNTAADANSAATITDGATEIPLVPSTAFIGVYTADFGDGLISQEGAWSATTGSAVTLIVVGDFG